MVKVKVTLLYAGILNETLEETEAIMDGVERILKDEVLDSSLKISQNFDIKKEINFYEEDEIFGERHEVLLDVKFYMHCNSLEELSEDIFEEYEDLLSDFSLDLESVRLKEDKEKMKIDVMIVTSQAIDIMYVNGNLFLVKKKISRLDLGRVISKLTKGLEKEIVYNEFEVTREFLWDYYPDEQYPSNLKTLFNDWESYYNKDID